MRTLSFTLSAVALLVSIFFLISDFRLSTESDYLLYMGMLVTLIFICCLGLVINAPMWMRGRKKVRSLIYNSYSSNRIRNKSFDSQFGLM